MSETQSLCGPGSAPPITPSSVTRDHTRIDGAQLKVYPGAHGITDTHKEQLGADLLEFLNVTNERAADESCHVYT